MISGFSTATPYYGSSQTGGPGIKGENSHAHTPQQKEDKKSKDPNELTDSEKEQVRKLAARDAEVRAHEMAHMAVAGSLARGGPSYEYQVGPDGKNYAIGGHVNIDTSPGNTPEETKQKAAQIRASALAPSDPSPQDLKVAASASSMAANAEQEAKQKEGDESKIDGENESFFQSSFPDDEEKADVAKAREANKPKSKFSQVLSAYDKAKSDQTESIYNFVA